MSICDGAGPSPRPRIHEVPDGEHRQTVRAPLRAVTSPVLSPLGLACARLLFAPYVLVTSIVDLARNTQGSSDNNEGTTAFLEKRRILPAVSHILYGLDRGAFKGFAIRKQGEGFGTVVVDVSKGTASLWRRRTLWRRKLKRSIYIV